MILAGGDPDAIITANMLPEEIGSNVPLPVNGGAEHLMSLPLREAREIFEREYLLAQINRFGGNISRTAEFVGMERSALHRKLRALGVRARQERAGEHAEDRGIMTRIVYVNGRYLPYAEAAVHAEDRGFQFADAVYEVCEVSGGRLVDETRHMARLARSLGELAHRPADGDAAPGRACMRETIRRNRVRDGLVYLQVTRGARPRDFLFPPDDVDADRRLPGAQRIPARLEAAAAAGIAVKTMPDTRWARCDIKTVMLLPACARQGGGAQGGGARRPGSSTTTGYRHRGRILATPGSSTGRGGSSPADRQRHPARRDAHDADRPAQAGGHRAGRAAVHRGGGQGGARGFHHLGHQYRDAGGAHRRQAGRQRRAGLLSLKGCGPNFIRRPKLRRALILSVCQRQFALEVAPNLLVQHWNDLHFIGVGWRAWRCRGLPQNKHGQQQWPNEPKAFRTRS